MRGNHLHSCVGTIGTMHEKLKQCGLTGIVEAAIRSGRRITRSQLPTIAVAL